jgi:hypothetical protein
MEEERGSYLWQVKKRLGSLIEDQTIRPSSKLIVRWE